ncbi:DUF4232 domain-containing protein [Dactylosporangium sp. AC04546]|uniref:DUF4232 domain-containing protein n=1 Tax=Dactylosporangium sp. AC04546 TaxID=2862460 RepID=UPI001EDD963F|nr:DUF4232 domain-containing protein [Dactylosporangium sp. AC04546]WVK79883.1 DUF4232 domain-containing protein [Dactylosporangium sp. AC04546]
MALLLAVLVLAAGCGTRRDGDEAPGSGITAPSADDRGADDRGASPVPHAPVLSHPAPSRSPSVFPGTPRPTCVGGLSVTVGGFDAAMGLRALGIRLTNCGSSGYRIRGEPTVRLLDAERKPFEITVNAAEAPALPDQYQGPAPEIVLAPGESAAAMVLWRNTLTDYTTATMGTYLEVVPGPGQAPQLLTERGPYDTGNTARLRVSHWIRADPPR